MGIFAQKTVVHREQAQVKLFAEFDAKSRTKQTIHKLLFKITQVINSAIYVFMHDT